VFKDLRQFNRASSLFSLSSPSPQGEGDKGGEVMIKISQRLAVSRHYGIIIAVGGDAA
jgi:hypothetical protein